MKKSDLAEKIDSLEQEIKALKSENSSLRQRIAALEGKDEQIWQWPLPFPNPYSPGGWTFR